MTPKTFKILLLVGLLSSQFGFWVDGARGGRIECDSPRFKLIKDLRDNNADLEVVSISSDKKLESCIKCTKVSEGVVSQCVKYEIDVELREKVRKSVQ